MEDDVVAGVNVAALKTGYVSLIVEEPVGPCAARALHPNEAREVALALMLAAKEADK